MIDNRLIIVSMTSWEKRINNVKTVVSSLLDQRLMPDYIELNLSKDEFPLQNKSLPTDLYEFVVQHNDIVEINWCDGNDGVFKKIIPTIKKFLGQNYYLLSVDDDWIYRNDYIELMIGYLKKYKSDTFCLANTTVIGNRQIYLSECFEKDFYEKLTKEVVKTRIDDAYIDYYLKSKNKKFAGFRPDDAPDITRCFNPVFPNSHNEETGSYSTEDINNAASVIKKIIF